MLILKIYPRIETDQPEILDVRGFPCSIGRSSSNDVVLTHPSISGRHATVKRTPQGLVLVDLGSTNGTLYKGIRRNELLLESGQEVFLGQVRIQIEIVITEEDLADAERAKLEQNENSQKTRLDETAVGQLKPAAAAEKPGVDITTVGRSIQRTNPDGVAGVTRPAPSSTPPGAPPVLPPPLILDDSPKAWSKVIVGAAIAFTALDVLHALCFKAFSPAWIPVLVPLQLLGGMIGACPFALVSRLLTTKYRFWPLYAVTLVFAVVFQFVGEFEPVAAFNLNSPEIFSNLADAGRGLYYFLFFYFAGRAMTKAAPARKLGAIAACLVVAFGVADLKLRSFFPGERELAASRLGMPLRHFAPERYPVAKLTEALESSFEKIERDQAKAARERKP